MFKLIDLFLKRYSLDILSKLTIFKLHFKRWFGGLAISCTRKEVSFVANVTLLYFLFILLSYILNLMNFDHLFSFKWNYNIETKTWKKLRSVQPFNHLLKGCNFEISKFYALSFMFYMSMEKDTWKNCRKSVSLSKYQPLNLQILLQ